MNYKSNHQEDKTNIEFTVGGPEDSESESSHLSKINLNNHKNNAIRGQEHNESESSQPSNTSSSHVEETNNAEKLSPMVLTVACPLIPFERKKETKRHSMNNIKPNINEDIVDSTPKQINLKHTIGGTKNYSIVILNNRNSMTNRYISQNLKNSFFGPEDEINSKSQSQIRKSYTLKESSVIDNNPNNYDDGIDNFSIVKSENYCITENSCKDKLEDISDDETENIKNKLDNLEISSKIKNIKANKVNYDSNVLSNDSSQPIMSSQMNEVPVQTIENVQHSPEEPLKLKFSIDNKNNFNFAINQERRYKRKDLILAKNYFKYRYISEKLIEINNVSLTTNNINVNNINNAEAKIQNPLSNSKDFSFNGNNAVNSPFVYSAEDKNVIKFTCIFLQKIEKSIFLFNMKKYEDSYNYLNESKIIRNLEEFGEILLIFPGFDKFIIGEFLSKEKKPNENLVLTNILIYHMDFRDEYFLESFRYLLSRINLPKDSSLILNIINVFSNVYFEDNYKNGLFQDVNAVYLLASTILALNTILHRNIPNTRLIKKDEFIKMNEHVDKRLCDEIYEEVKIKKLDIIYDYNEQIYRRLDINKDDIIKSSLMVGNFNQTNLNVVNALRTEAVPAHPDRAEFALNGEELIYMLKQGQIFIKYGRSGHPHERFVYLSSDEKSLNWKSLSCNCFSRDRSIKSTWISNIYIGTSNSNIFEKYKVSPELELNCFSIIAENRSLDLKHDDAKISKKWYHAIKYLIKRAKSMAEVKKKKLKELTNRKEIISDFWRTEIIPNWEKYRKFLLIKGNSDCQNQFFTNNEIYKKNFKNILTEKKPKLVIEEKNKQDVTYMWFLGIPDWLRKKMWSLVIANDINFNENLFNYYLKKIESIDLNRDIEYNRKDSSQQTPGMPEYTNDKMDVKNPLLSEIIIDIHKSYKRFEDSIKAENIDENKFKEDLFKIVRIFTNYRPDITYSRAISYISTIFYLNSEDFYEAFILTSNFIIPSFLSKFLIRDEIFIKTRCEFFENLLGNYIPSVYTHFKNLDISTHLFYYDWIEFLFTKTFKYQTILRIWDCYLAKGEIFLYEVALSLIKLQEKDLVNSTVKGILSSLSYFEDKYSENDLFGVIEKIDINLEYQLLIDQDELAKEKTHLYSAFLFY